MDNNILIIAVIDSMIRIEDKEHIEDSIKAGLDKGIIVKDKSISNLYVIDREKKELITIVY